MSSTESRISLNVRTATGTQITIRAESADELDNTIALSIDSIKSAVAEMEAAAGLAKPSATQSVQATIAASFPGAKVVDTPPFSPAPIGGGRNCPHGKMKAQQGTSKQDGGIYKGYFCPADKNDVGKCKNIYLKNFEPEWQTFVPEKIV